MQSREERRMLKAFAATIVGNDILAMDKVAKAIDFNKRLQDTAIDIKIRLYGLYNRLLGIKK